MHADVGGVGDGDDGELEQAMPSATVTSTIAKRTMRSRVVVASRPDKLSGDEMPGVAIRCVR